MIIVRLLASRIRSPLVWPTVAAVINSLWWMVVWILATKVFDDYTGLRPSGLLAAVYTGFFAPVAFILTFLLTWAVQALMGPRRFVAAAAAGIIIAMAIAVWVVFAFPLSE